MDKRKVPEQALKALSAKVDGEVGLYVSIPEENQRLVLNGDLVLHAASTIKVPVLSLLFQDAEAGLVDLDKKRTVKPDNRVGGSGILQSLSPDLELSLFDLAVLMIVMSDNTATNEVIDAVGMDRVREFCLTNGFRSTWIWGKMYYKGFVPPARIPEGAPRNAISANDLGGMLEQLASGLFVSKDVSRKIVQIMAGQRLSRLKALLPFVERVNPHADRLELPPEGKVVVASKSGTLTGSGIAHDAGIFYLPDGRYYVMAMLTQSYSILETTKIINEVGLTMYEAMR